MKINFYSNSNIENFFKKKRRMRILSTVFFLSFLAAKFATFERMLLTEPINLFGKTKRMRL